MKSSTAGLSEAGSLSFMLSWVGRGPDAASIAASSAGAIPGISCWVESMEGMTHLNWYDTKELTLGDELRVRLISTDLSDPPLRTESIPRGNPGELKITKRPR